MRKLEDVIDKMLAVIPEEQKQLRATLEANKGCVLLIPSSPEGQGDWWNETADNLNAAIGDLHRSDPWAIEAIRIFTDGPMPHDKPAEPILVDVKAPVPVDPDTFDLPIVNYLLDQRQRILDDNCDVKTVCLVFDELVQKFAKKES